MFMDNSLSFNTNWATAQAITTTADGSTVVDITGAGSGNAPSMINGFPATNTAIGEDYGSGDSNVRPNLLLVVTTAGTGAGTITVSVSAAPDNGSYGQGTYTALYTSKAFVGTTLVKGAVLNVPLPPILNTLSEALPRFYKITYTVSGSATASVLSGLTINNSSFGLGGLYNNNFLAV